MAIEARCCRHGSGPSCQGRGRPGASNRRRLEALSWALPWLLCEPVGAAAAEFTRVVATLAEATGALPTSAEVGGFDSSAAMALDMALCSWPSTCIVPSSRAKAARKPAAS